MVIHAPTHRPPFAVVCDISLKKGEKKERKKKRAGDSMIKDKHLPVYKSTRLVCGVYM